MATDPLSGIDTLVAQALTRSVELTDVVPASKIQMWDRDVDVRGEMETATDLGGRIWIQPGRSTTALNYSSGSAKFTRRYTVGFGIGHMRLSECRRIEWLIIRALTWFSEGLIPPDPSEGSDPSPISQPTPLAIESIGLDGTDPEREPIADPQEWTDVCEVIVTAFAARAALMQ